MQRTSKLFPPTYPSHLTSISSTGPNEGMMVADSGREQKCWNQREPKKKYSRLFTYKFLLVCRIVVEMLTAHWWAGCSCHRHLLFDLVLFKHFLLIDPYHIIILKRDDTRYLSPLLTSLVTGGRRNIDGTTAVPIIRRILLWHSSRWITDKVNCTVYLSHL